MRYHTFSRLGLKVSAICLGTAEMGSVMPGKEAFSMLDFYREQGGNFLDTAHVYGDLVSQERGASERTLGEWMKDRGCRSQIVLATKGGHPRFESMEIPRLSRRELTADLEESLLNLQTDYIDLYWLHRDDPAMPVEEVLDTLKLFVKEGKIRSFGLSNWQLPRLREAVMYQSRYLLGSQILWSLARPKMDVVNDPSIAAMNEETWKFHAECGLAAVPYTAQARGFFSKLEHGADTMQDWVRATYDTQENRERYGRLKNLATETGISIEALVPAYLINQPFTTIPVISSRKNEQLAETLKAADVILMPEQVTYLRTGESIL